MEFFQHKISNTKAESDANPLHTQYTDDLFAGTRVEFVAHRVSGYQTNMQRDASLADSLIGQTPWKNSSYYRQATHNGAYGCALLVGNAVGLPGTLGVHDLESKLRDKGYSPPVSVIAQSDLPEGAVLIGTRGWNSGDSHVRLMDRSGMVVDNAYNENTKQWEGVKETIGDFMSRHPGMRFYALMPPGSRRR